MGNYWSLAERAGFEVFVTVDRGIEFEQNLTRRNIAVILVCAKSSRLADLLPLVPEILQLLPSIKRRQLVRVGS